MEEIYDVTKTELIEVFKRWNEEWINNPKGFSKIKLGTETRQAESFIEYLKEVRNSK